MPSATEVLCALGARDLLVGRSAWCDEPPEVRSLPAVGDATSVNPESVLALRPDLVLVFSAAQEEALGPLRARVPVLRVEVDTIHGVRGLIRSLAARTGRREEGESLLAGIDGALRAARDRAAPGGGPSVLFVVQHEPLVVAGEGSYVGELLTALGARNAATDLASPWPTLSYEALVARDPDLVLDATLAPGSGGDPAAFWGRFPTLRAVTGGRVRRVDSEAVLRPGPRLPEALRILGGLLGGEGR